MSARLLQSALLLCVALVAGQVPALAAPPLPEFELPDVVSPGRRPQRAAASPASVAVLTAGDLVRLGVRTVGEALAFLPETLARAYGGPGSLITASIRGSSAEQVLVLLDGVPVTGALAGTVDLSTIPLDDVERIEVLRGPFSAIYGGGALGGVISIVTRRRAAPAAAVGGGSFGAWSVGLAGGGDGRFSLRYEAAEGARPNSDLQAGYLSLRLGDQRGDRRWDFSLTGTSAVRGVPGSTLFPSPRARQEDRRLAAVLTLDRDHADRGGRSTTQRLRLSLHADGLAFRDPRWGIDDRHDGLTWSAEWQRVVRISPTRTVTAGADAVWQSLRSTSVGDRSAVSGALYLQDDRALGPRTLLSAGLRVDAHDASGVQVNPRVGLVYFVRPDVRLRLAAGRTFRGPSLADRYFPFDGFAVGNPGLRPEHAWSVDAGLEATLGPSVVLRATAFWSEVRDLILWVPDAAFVFSPQNVGSASIRGASVEVEGMLAPLWRLRASSTRMVASDGATGLDLPNRPRHMAALALTRDLPNGGSITASAVHVEARFADAANTVVLPAYVTAGLSLQMPLGAGLVLRASAQNLFDARFEAVQGYPAPGRSLWVEIILRR